MAARMLFVLAIIVTGGLYGYREYLINTIVAKEADITRIKEAINPDLVDSLSGTARLLKNAGTLLNGHIAFSEFLKFLEGGTLQTLRFDDLRFGDPQGKELLLTMTGEARDYASIALQADVFEHEKNVINPVFSNFVLTQKGTIKFEVKATLNKNIVSYRNKIHKDLPASPGETPVAPPVSEPQ